MITCPWCGTSYSAFQSNCQKCGGPLPPPAEREPAGAGAARLKPPPAPRPIADSYGRHLLLADGWAVTSAILALIGGIFTLLGFILTMAIITAFVGIPFGVIGLLLLGVGLAGLLWRQQQVQKTMAVLRYGEPAEGQIVSVEENMMVRINHRHPWVIGYRFQLNGREYAGSVTTLNRTDLQAGQPACVLYLPQGPEYNALYPHP